MRKVQILARELDAGDILVTDDARDVVTQVIDTGEPLITVCAARLGLGNCSDYPVNWHRDSKVFVERPLPNPMDGLYAIGTPVLVDVDVDMFRTGVVCGVRVETKVVASLVSNVTPENASSNVQYQIIWTKGSVGTNHPWFEQHLVKATASEFHQIKKFL
jgi:hypothetical protein